MFKKIRALLLIVTVLNFLVVSSVIFASNRGMHDRGSNYLHREPDQYQMQVKRGVIGYNKTSYFEVDIFRLKSEIDNLGPEPEKKEAEEKDEGEGLPGTDSGFDGESYEWKTPAWGRLSSSYHDPNRSNPHKGLDISRNEWYPAFAAAPGVVKRSYFSESAGAYIVIDHGNGWETGYMHLWVRDVKEGDKVSAGQMIGSIGNSGRSFGAHLHFEVKYKGKHLDPQKYIKAYKGVRAGGLSSESYACHDGSKSICRYSMDAKWTYGSGARQDKSVRARNTVKKK